MGVEGLNNIIKQTPKEVPRRYRRIIIDGSNLIANKLASSVKQLFNRHPIDEWKSPNKDILYQTKFLINNSVKDIKHFLEHCYTKYKPEEIYLVMDPKDTPLYTVNADMPFENELIIAPPTEDEHHDTQQLVDIDAPPDSVQMEDITPVVQTSAPVVPTNPNILRFNPYITDILLQSEIDDNVTVSFDIKKEEQDKRKSQHSKDKQVKRILDDIASIGIDEDYIDIVNNLFHQAFFYNHFGNMLKLGRIILLHIEEAFVGRKLFIIDAKDEADLVIKNIAKNNITSLLPSDGSDVPLSVIPSIHPDATSTIPAGTIDYTLIISMDTDYYVLFSDTPTVHCRAICDDFIYSPYKCWKGYLASAYSYDAVIRCSALFGNDYTIHESVTFAKDHPEDMQCLFNIDSKHKFTNLYKNARKKIYHVVANCHDPPAVDECTPLSLIDSLIHDYNIVYFRKYFISTIVYKNWNVYNSCTIRRTLDFPTAIAAETDWVMQFIYKSFKVIYKWDNVSTLFSNWDDFIPTINEKFYKSWEPLRERYLSTNTDDMLFEYDASIFL